ncbi:formimidoylglutamase [Bacillus sp. FJAT-27231]|uniref:formimidoylglutamase n=1 Tax=Bacillus sp. FJAT-27231 TaxID=1679168 RepID=UPI000670FEB7|nr:formimidoylglutamase [Bacillus sp. FJAT-27231]KMY55281.1 formimidoylglutamase [Bacillus sp. FJAT-27231]
MYTLPDKQYWSGRIDSENDQNAFRLHQVVELKDVETLAENESAFGFVGFECEEGVRRNKGRLGAALAPNKIRQFLSPLPYNLERKLLDTGNVACEGQELEKAQEELGRHLHKLYSSSCTPIILGGGHETLYGHYLGARNHIGPDASLGIINIDAHFDMRDEPLPSSGTMFKQILEQDAHAGYLCIGIQEFGNTESLFQTANRLGCTYIYEEDVAANNFIKTFGEIDRFAANYDYLILTLCTDSIISYAAPGVSAPSPFGLDPKTVKTLLRYIAEKDNLLSFDISEVNPVYDEGDRTVRLAAYLIAEVLRHFNKKQTS